MAATLAMPRWHDEPLYAFWCCLCVFLLVHVTSARVTLTLVGSGLALTFVVLVRAAGPGHETLLETSSIPLTALPPLALGWYGTRYRKASCEISWLKEQLQATLDSERQFVRNVAHEFRTPLTIARGHLDLAMAAPGSPASQLDMIVVAEELTILTRSIQRLLDLVMSGREEFVRPVAVRVADLVEDTVARWSNVVPRRWSVVPGPVAVVDLDPDRVSVALDALIENAVDFTTETGAIEIAVVSAGSYVAIRVRDSGCGIAAERLVALSESSFGKDRDHRRFGGTGLGLAIVRTIVAAHGGHVTIDSVPGEGTTVALFFPMLHPVADVDEARVA